MSRYEKLVGNWRTIREECLAVRNEPIFSRARKHDQWVHGENKLEQGVRDMILNQSGWLKIEKRGKIVDGWLNYPVFVDGKPVNEDKCPKTTALLSSMSGVNVAGFSLLKPRAVIPRHVDATGVRYGTIATHLGLICPRRCALHVEGASPVLEHDGVLFVFDATIPHVAWNGSDQDRYILYLDMQI